LTISTASTPPPQLWILPCVQLLYFFTAIIHTCHQRFFIEYRKGLLHFEAAAKGSVVKAIQDEADFETRGGTKMKMIVTILKHRFTQNWMPQIVFNIDGTADYPPVSPPPQPADPQDLDAAELLAWQLQSSRKAILFQVFTSMREFIASCLIVNGIKCAWINGEMSFAQRAEAVERFRSDAEIRVLIISAVGGTGLNLAFADIVIFGVSSTLLTAFSH
jgi:hypothetical protein